ncbi:hypothetical protein BDZ97DRAFT_1790231 [Flammula alnicola]|nr:hypothetical protein BDZ97DRAFT_1790231 [Flammula alnicola]
MLELFALERRDKPLATYGDADPENEPEPGWVDDDEDDDDEEIFEEEKAMADQKFIKRIQTDRKVYARTKEVWEQDVDNRRLKHGSYSDLFKAEFMSFEEYTSLRESWLASWGASYRNMLESPEALNVDLVPKVREVVNSDPSKPWVKMDWYEKWVISMYGEGVIKKFGGLKAVDPGLIPVGMVQLFRSSRMKLDQ